MIIGNAANRPLNTNSGTLPDVSGAMLDYFQPMTFELLVKTVQGYQLAEDPTIFQFQGVWQPFSEQQLSVKPEGQRKWKWFWLHAQPSLDLAPDDVVLYQGVQYRVMARKDYNLYGYIEYHLVDDYTGSGPT